MSLLARKSIGELRADASEARVAGLRRALGPVDLVALGVAAIAGTGVFTLVGSAAGQQHPVELAMSILLAAVACALVGLCYAELAASIPHAGSAYTYGYAAIGELFAWMIGWLLLLVYLLAAAIAASAWSARAVGALRDLGVVVGPHWSTARGLERVKLPATGEWVALTEETAGQIADGGAGIAAAPIAAGAFDLAAVAAVVSSSALLIVGIRWTARVNNALVLVTLGLVVVVLLAGADADLGGRGMPGGAAGGVQPLLPTGAVDPGMDASGLVGAAGLLFFSLVGFDVVSTAGQEAKNPRRDLPIGILGSLLISTVVYLLLAQRSSAGHEDDPTRTGAEHLAPGALMEAGALAVLPAVILVMLLAQSRIFSAIGGDGLLPRSLAKLHPRFRTPHVAILVSGLLCSMLAGGLPMTALGELVSAGILLVYAGVCLSVVCLRIREPERPRPFRAPMVPLVPITGILVCLFMMSGIPGGTWLRLLGWTSVGLVVYLAYGRRHSILQRSLAVGNQNAADAANYGRRDP